MGESQSRYGIMEQLNNRKLNEKEKLENLKQELRQKEIEFGLQQEKLKNSLVIESSNYKSNFSAWKRNKELEIEVYKSKMESKITELQDEIAETQSSLEPNHKAKVRQWEEALAEGKKEFGNYKDKQESKIKAKEDTITEIEKAIKDLKEMSKEQAGKE